MTICKDCEWGVIGEYSKVYGGNPIGCNRPDDDRLYKFNGIHGCFKPKKILGGCSDDNDSTGDC